MYAVKASQYGEKIIVGDAGGIHEDVEIRKRIMDGVSILQKY